MKKILFLLLVSASAFSQDFSNIKAKTKHYYKIKTAEALAEKIDLDFSSDENKVKAIFCWMTDNIRFDLAEFNNPNRKKRISFRYRTIEEREAKLQELKDNLVATTLTTRKGVCAGYAHTFSKICSLLNIENEVIRGYVRTNSNTINKPILQPNHAWNAVKLNNKWVYIDPTWASGYEINKKWKRKFIPYYYDIPVKHYFKTHLPEKSIWKLRIGDMEKNDFYKQPIFKYQFLTSGVQLISPTTGTFNKNKQDEIQIQLKNIQPTQPIHIGFRGTQFAQKPKVTSKNGITTVTANPPKNAQQLFLLIDKEIVLEFLIGI